MALKSLYTIEQFANQIEYANYMLQSIHNENISDIIFNGSKNEFFKSRIYKKIMDLKSKDPLLKDIYENYSDYLIIRSRGTKKRRKKN